MIVGMMIGAVASWLKTSFPGYRPRTRLNASSVPSTVASPVVHTATFRLRTVASSHAGSAKYALYHRKERPGGGNCRYEAELKEIGTTMNSGAMRNAKTAHV